MSPPTTRWRGFPSDVHTLSVKVDQLARADGKGDILSVLEQRIAALTTALESRERPAAGDTSDFVEGALRTHSPTVSTLMPVGSDNASAFAHLEQRVSYLLERLEASTDRGAAPSLDLGRVEEGLLPTSCVHLESQHASLVALADQTAAAAAPPAMDT